MDTCLRKQLIVTCSKSYIMIWNYKEGKFLLAYKITSSNEQGCTSVAFHPSGFHFIACVGDKLLVMKVLSKSISEQHSLTLKNCKEVRFSNGGQFFAVGVSCYTYVYNFYTLTCPSNQQCKGHTGRIQEIEWFQDDSGFSDACQGGMVYFYDMQMQRLEMTRCKEDDFKRKKCTGIQGITNVPGSKNRAIVASADRKLWDTADIYE